MPKLTLSADCLRRESGSVLVGVVTVAILMGIASVGYLTMTGTTVNNEAEGLDNERAFFAAESGLLVGTRWLRDSANWYGLPSGVTNVYDTSMNGMAIDVDVVSSSGVVVVQSDAVGGILTYTKRLSWTVDVSNPYRPGVFINCLGPSGGVGGSGLNNTWFDGPFHANTPIYLSSVSNPGASGSGVYFVNGGVTTYNETAQENFPTGDWGNYGSGNSDYDFGIFHHNLSQNTDQSAKLNDYFSSTFTHSQDSIYMPRITSQDVTLPVANEGPGRPVLVFGKNKTTNEGIATYYYYDGAGVKQEVTVAIDGKVIRVPNNVSVLGTVKGQATLVTDPGASIYPVGDLVYDKFAPASQADYDDYDNSNNYGVGDLSYSDDMLALVSGGDIYFEQTKRRFDEGTKQLVATGVAKQEMFLTAMLIASEPGHGTWWVTRDGTRHGDIEINKYDYTLRAIGSRTLDEWYSYDAGGVQANQMIRFFFDTRINDGLIAPGVPLYQTNQGGNVLLIFNGDWSETNIPL
jgi:hypothetical protein